MSKLRKRKRDKFGKFLPTNGTYIDDKGYLRVSFGPYKGQRLHRILAAFKLGRPLRPDEDVHHEGKDKLTFDYEKIIVKGHREHGCYHTRQHSVKKQEDIREMQEIESYFRDEARPVDSFAMEDR
jgi:hypothetical protein